MADGNVWTVILERLKAELDSEEFRRWFANSSYASDSGDVITVWVQSIADGRQIQQNYVDRLQRVLTAIGRDDTTVRFLATGYTGDDNEDEDAE